MKRGDDMKGDFQYTGHANRISFTLVLLPVIMGVVLLWLLGYVPVIPFP